MGVSCCGDAPEALDSLRDPLRLIRRPRPVPELFPCYELYQKRVRILDGKE